MPRVDKDVFGFSNMRDIDKLELIGRIVIAAAIIIAGFFISDAIRDAGVTIATRIANAIH